MGSKNGKRANAKQSKRVREGATPGLVAAAPARADEPPVHSGDDARTDEVLRVEELLAALQSQRDEIARISGLLAELVDSRRLADRQMERILTLQQRTNALVELLLGSAFDVELGEPRRP